VIADGRGDVVRFVAVWLASAVSGVGSGVTGFVLGVWVYQSTGSPTRLAVVLVAALVPALVLGPFAGVVVDRFNRRTVLIVTDSLSAAPTVAVAALYATDHLAVWHVYAAAAASAACGVFHLTTYQALTPLLIPHRHLGRANGFMQAAWAAQIAAPLAAGALQASLGLAGVLVLDLATFALAVGVLLAVRLPATVVRPRRARRAPSFGADLAFGWRYLRRHRPLLTLVGVLTAFNFGFASAGVLVQPLILSFASVPVLGALQFAGGAGMFAGALLMGAWGGPRRRMAGVAAFTAVGGVALLLHAPRPSTVLIGLAAPVFLFTLPVVNACAHTVLQTKVPAEALGRVMGTAHTLAKVAMPVAYLAAAPVAEHLAEPAMRQGGPLAGSLGRLIGVGPGRGIAAMFLLSGVVLVILAAVVATTPALRHIETDLPDAVRDDDADPPGGPACGDEPSGAGIAKGVTHAGRPV
jgi:MFS transporter, DHA3 family, macrolide efflux protein